MLKSISNLEGAKILSSSERKQINGGRIPRNICHSDSECHYTQTCIGCICSAPGDPV